MAIQYDAVLNAVAENLPVVGVPELVLDILLTDGWNSGIDWFSLPPHIQKYIEDKYCVDHPGNDDDGYMTTLWGLKHSRGDEPAVVYPNIRCKVWYKCGIEHRDGDLPSKFIFYGIWFTKKGRKHRDGDLPAYVLYDGSMEWWKNGVQYDFFEI